MWTSSTSLSTNATEPDSKYLSDATQPYHSAECIAFANISSKIKKRWSCGSLPVWRAARRRFWRSRRLAILSSSPSVLPRPPSTMPAVVLPTPTPEELDGLTISPAPAIPRPQDRDLAGLRKTFLPTIHRPRIRHRHGRGRTRFSILPPPLAVRQRQP